MTNKKLIASAAGCRTVGRQWSRAGKAGVWTADVVLERLMNDVDQRCTVEHDRGEVERRQRERRRRRLV